MKALEFPEGVVLKPLSHFNIISIGQSAREHRYPSLRIFDPIELSRSSGISLWLDVEAGYHHTEYEDYIRRMDLTGLQCDSIIVATTCSLEYIHAAYRYFSTQDTYELSYFRIDYNSKAQSFEAIYYPRETLAAAIDMDYEIR